MKNQSKQAYPEILGYACVLLYKLPKINPEIEQKFQIFVEHSNLTFEVESV